MHAVTTDARLTDEHFMRMALDLAERGRHSVSPNPMVGCVIVRDGRVIAQGWHQRAGEAHAEAIALAQDVDVTGATMYVSLEPCSHHGRTPPCADRVATSAVSRVVVGMRDPHEVVDGRGIEILRKAGVDVTTGILESEARRLNEVFVYAITQKLPFVTIKAGMTLDGKLATVARQSQWITSEEARNESLRLREQHDAILVGGGTVAADNPRLTRRLGLASGITPWTRVVLDGDGQVPAHAQMLHDGGRTLLFTRDAARFDSSPGLEIVETDGRADLAQILGELYARGLHSVLVEGGSVVLSEVIRRGLWQKMIVFIAPTIVGGGDAPSIFGGEGFSRLTDAPRFRFDRAEFVGTDLMVTAYPS